MSFYAHTDVESDLSADLNGMLSLTCYLPKYAFVPVQDHVHQLSTLSQHWLACFRASLFLRLRAAGQAVFVFVKPRQLGSNEMH